jgi:putative pyrroloquinoline-quinone binding quinoprotein
MASLPGWRRGLVPGAFSATAVAVTAVLGALAPGGAPAAAAAASGPGPGGNWTVYHHDLAGSGKAGPVTTVHTGRRAWTSPQLDGVLFGEPLVWSGRVYVATENNTVYALSTATGQVVWKRHVAPAVPASALPCGNISPTVGITGTPVIDPARREIFAVADELRNGKPAHVLVGLDAVTGASRMAVDVDPAGDVRAALLQRTGLTLAGGRVVFGFGGNIGDCSLYHGRVVSVPEGGGKPAFFTVDARPGQRQGAVWMGGGAPAVDRRGNVWVTSGNGSVRTAGQPYDNSDAVLELTPGMRLLDFFAPREWAADNAADKDFSATPALLPSGQVVAAGKSQIGYLLDGAHLGGIGGEKARLDGVCQSDVDGGIAMSGQVVYLPCESGIVAVRASVSPPGLHRVWSAGTGGGPPILAAGLVWTIGQNGELYGLDPARGTVRQRAAVGAPANHFPTPAAGDGLMLAANTRQVVAFPVTGNRVPAAGPSSGSGAGPQLGNPPAARPDQGGGLRTVVLIAVPVVVVALLAAGLWVRRRRGAAAH